MGIYTLKCLLSLLGKEEKSMYVQAFINNISFPKTIEELDYFVSGRGRFNLEDILYSQWEEWTTPKWALKNDIVFFFHAKTAIQRIRHLELELLRDSDAVENKNELLDALDRAKRLYKSYGGKIFAVARVAGRPFRDSDEPEVTLHWSGRIYAKVDQICVLEKPIDISEFRSFIQISHQSAITILCGDSFERLKMIIKEYNVIPKYLEKADTTPFPIRNINQGNWLSVTYEYRRHFFLEIQFRKYYVDYLLQEIADRKRIYSECVCYKNNHLSGYADNCIILDSKKCFVEVKLNFDTEKELSTQLLKYIDVEKTYLTPDESCVENIGQRCVIAIDTKSIAAFDANIQRLTTIVQLDNIKNNKDLQHVRKCLIETIRTIEE